MFQTELHNEVERLLKELRSIKEVTEKVEREYNEIIEMVTGAYNERISRLKEKFAEKERELMRLAKGNKKDLFGSSDVYETEYGRLIREMAEVLKISRETLKKCEELGFVEAIKIAKSLDRSVLERWPDERLFLVGARRELVERIDYELK